MSLIKTFFKHLLNKTSKQNNSFNQDKLSSYKQKLANDPSNTYYKTKVNKLIKEKIFTKLFLIILVMIFLEAFVINVALQMYDDCFYNPIDNKVNSRMFSYVLDAFTKLHSPGYQIIYASSKSLGMGKRELEIHTLQDFRFNHGITKANLIRNKLSDDITVFCPLAPKDAFVQNIIIDKTTEKSQIMSYIKDLPRASKIAVFVSFTEDIDMDRFVTMYKEFDSVKFEWLALRYTDNKNSMQLGFAPFNGYYSKHDIIPESEYPCFFLSKLSKPNTSATTFNTHVKSLLKFISTHEQFLDVFCNSLGLNSDYYTDAYNYIEEHGAKSYGALIHGEAVNIYNFLS